MRGQKAVWLAWPPPLLRTVVRISSGTLARSRSRSSTDFAASSGGGQGGIQVVDVGLVVLVVVDLHRLCVDERLQSGVVVGKRCEFVCHRGNLLHDACCAEFCVEPVGAGNSGRGGMKLNLHTCRNGPLPEWMREGTGRVRESWRVPFERNGTGMIFLRGKS